MNKTILFHDGCGVCLSIEASFAQLFSGGPVGFESVNLGLDKHRSAEAVQLGITRLPSLVVNGKVLKVDDHSPIEHYMPTVDSEYS